MARCSASSCRCVAAIRASTVVFDKPNENLSGTIAPNKRAMGYYGVEVPRDARTIEIRISEAYLYNIDEYVTFIFDVPSIVVE